MSLRATRQYVDTLKKGTGKARATRHYTDVLKKATGKARATRQYVDVAISYVPIVVEKSAANIINLFDAVGYCVGNAVGRSANNTLSLAGVASYYAGVTVEKSASNTLSLVDELTSSVIQIKEASASNTLSLTDTAIAGTARLCADDLGISQEVVVGCVLVREVEDSLNLSQNVQVTTPINVSVEHNLGLMGASSAISPYYRSVTDNIDFDDSPINDQDAGASATSTLTLTGIAVRIVNISVSDSLGLLDGGLERYIGESALDFTQEATWGYGGLASDSVILSQAVDACLLLTRLQSHILAIQQSVAYYIGNRRVDYQYCPFTTEGSPVAATLNEPMPGIEAPFQLVYPAEGIVTDSVTLRAPNLGNKDRLSFNRVMRETRGGTLIVFADPIWPKIQTLVLSFSGLRQSEAQDLLTFFNDYLGQEVGMIDWEQRYWKGIILVSEEPIIEDSFNSYTASFQFEGELDETWTPQVIPWLPGTPLRRTRPEYGPVNPLEPEPPTEMEASYAAIADNSILIGQPIYIKSTSHAALAQADDVITSAAMGFAITAVEPTFTVRYLTEGKLTLTDWTAITGTALLVPGDVYYLDAAIAGRITNVAPLTPGQSVIHVGRAASTGTLDIEIDLSVYL